MRKIGILFFVFLISVSCNTTVKQNHETEEKQNLNQDEEVSQNIVESEGSTVIDLKYGFRIIFSKNEDFETFKTYWDTKIYLDNKVVYVDATNEYEINEKYPSIRKVKEKIEILLVNNDRPFINKLRLLIFSNGQFERDEYLPYFKMNPRDIDNDNLLELVGILNASEVWGDDTVYMPYNPIFVYELGDNGIVIDSVETEKINVRVYDKFYGYEYNSEISFVRNDKLGKVLEEFK